MKILYEGQSYRLPNGDNVICTNVVQGIRSDEDHGVMCCEIAHTARMEPCGFILESVDGSMMLMINASGDIARRDVEDTTCDEHGNVVHRRYGSWHQTGLTIEDLVAL